MELKINLNDHDTMNLRRCDGASLGTYKLSSFCNGRLVVVDTENPKFVHDVIWSPYLESWYSAKYRDNYIVLRCPAQTSDESGCGKLVTKRDAELRNAVEVTL